MAKTFLTLKLNYHISHPNIFAVLWTEGDGFALRKMGQGGKKTITKVSLFSPDLLIMEALVEMICERRLKNLPPRKFKR